MSNAYPVRRGAPAPAAPPAKSMPRMASSKRDDVGVASVGAKILPEDELDVIGRCYEHAKSKDIYLI